MDFSEELRRVTLLPCREYRPETALAVGETGLYMSAVAYDLFSKKMEISHAGEYIRAGKETDVAETVEAYTEQLAGVRRRVEQKKAKLLQCPEEDVQVIGAVSAFLDKFCEGLLELETLGGDVREHTTAETTEAYSRMLESIYQAADGYIRLHIGDVSYL